VRIVGFWLVVGSINDVLVTELTVLRDSLLVTVVALVRQTK
jgi:hypothetical protein